MARINIDFEWPRGRAYELVDPVLPKTDDPFAAKIDEPHIRQTGRTEKERRTPLAIDSELHFRFANLDGTPEACLKFAHHWGLLRTYAETGAQEPHSLWRKEIQRMKATLEGLRRAVEENAIAPTGAPITEMDLMLLPGKPGDRPLLSFRPHNLLSAMRVQLAQSVAGGNSIRRCPVCNIWFETAGRGSADTRRSIAIFCSKPCKNRHHYLRRAGK